MLLLLGRENNCWTASITEKNSSVTLFFSKKYPAITLFISQRLGKNRGAKKEKKRGFF